MNEPEANNQSSDPRRPRRRRRRITRAILVLLLAAAVTSGAWGAWRWFTYPRAPDVRTADLSTVIGFMAGSDFNRMFRSSRVDYVRGVCDRLFGLGLQKFYRMPPGARSLVLQMIASAEQAELERHPRSYPPPTPQRVRGSAMRLMSRQPPRVQAMREQFVIDLARERRAMGLPDGS